MTEINAQIHKTLRGIMKTEKISAEKLATWCKVSPISFRRMLRGEINMDVEIFSEALDQLGYKVIIVKKEYIV